MLLHRHHHAVAFLHPINFAMNFNVSDKNAVAIKPSPMVGKHKLKENAFSGKMPSNNFINPTNILHENRADCSQLSFVEPTTCMVCSMNEGEQTLLKM